MSDPVDFSITKQSGPNVGNLIRIEVADGPKLIGRIDISFHDFVTAMLDGIPVTAAYSTRRDT